MHYTPWVVSEHVPDFSTLENLLKHPRFAGKKDGALAEALWALMVDRDLGIFHYCPPSEQFWNRDSNDPLLIWNVFGFTICHVHANVLGSMFRAAGFVTRVANVQGHEGTEVFYEGRWHYFDGDIQMFHRLRPPHQHIIASREDLFNDPTLATDQPNPSKPYIFPDRPWQAVATMYKAPLEYQPVLEDRIHSMDFRLRPGEELTRYFHHLGRWFVFDHYPAMYRQYRRETGPEGPTERYWPRRQWGNGFFHYAPDLTVHSADAALGAESLTGLTATDRGLAAAGDLPGRAVFAFESPYLLCGVPDPFKRLPAEEGALLEVTFDIPAGGHAQVDCRAKSNGDTADPSTWETIWDSADQPGAQTAKIDYTALVEGRFGCELRVSLTGRGTTLTQFDNRLWFMVSPHSLPALRTVGANRMTVHHGDRFGLNTRATLTQRLCARTETIAAACETTNLRHDPTTMSVVHPVDPAKPWELVYELTAPAAQVSSTQTAAGGTVAWASVYALFEGRKPDEPPDGTPARIEVADALTGPWREIATAEIAEHLHGWHFGLFGQGRFEGKSSKGYVRFSAKKGLKGFRIASHYVPAAGANVADTAKLHAKPPLEIEHVWYEDDAKTGRRERHHVETVPTLNHAYTVPCQAEPHNAWITLRAGHEPA